MKGLAKVISRMEMSNRFKFANPKTAITSLGRKTKIGKEVITNGISKRSSG
jgi:hypothetical protein